MLCHVYPNDPCLLCPLAFIHIISFLCHVDTEFKKKKKKQRILDVEFVQIPNHGLSLSLQQVLVVANGWISSVNDPSGVPSREIGRVVFRLVDDDFWWGRESLI